MRPNTRRPGFVRARVPARPRRTAHARRRRREGAALLVVMLVLMVVTATAAVSVTTIQSELQAAGHDRVAMQARYLAEGAMMTTIAYIDQLADSGQWMDVWNDWAGVVPDMSMYGDAPVPLGTTASRTSMSEHDLLEVQSTDVAPVNSPDSTDLVGSFGPRQSYDAQLTWVDAGGTEIVVPGYAVDLTDCELAPTAATPGSPVGGGSGSLIIQQFNCTLTARARLEQQGTDGLERTWTYGTSTYRQNRFTTAHDSRAVIVTPPMILSQ